MPVAEMPTCEQTRRVLRDVDLAHPYNKVGDGPEGPEVRTVADKLTPFLLNKVLTAGYLSPRAKLVNGELLSYPATVTRISSYGKKLLIELDIGQTMIVSFAMTGRFQFMQGVHSHLAWDYSEVNEIGAMRVLTPKGQLYFDDRRYLGKIEVLPTVNISLYLQEFGPDLLQCALTEQTWLTREQWFQLFMVKKWWNRQLRLALTDQHLVAGIGNYLKSEILYYAGLLPSRKVNSLSAEELEKLRISAHQVIRLSYAYGGLTIEDFISPDGTLGIYPAAVYGRSHDPQGRPIQNDRSGPGQTSYWVPEVQR